MSYVWYFIGDVISKPMNRWNCFSWLYPTYHWLMMKSYYAQEKTGKGPWV